MKVAKTVITYKRKNSTKIEKKITLYIDKLYINHIVKRSIIHDTIQLHVDTFHSHKRAKRTIISIMLDLVEQFLRHYIFTSTK